MFLLVPNPSHFSVVMCLLFLRKIKFIRYQTTAWLWVWEVALWCWSWYSVFSNASWDNSCPAGGQSTAVKLTGRVGFFSWFCAVVAFFPFLVNVCKEMKGNKLLQSELSQMFWGGHRAWALASCWTVACLSLTGVVTRKKNEGNTNSDRKSKAWRIHL